MNPPIARKPKLHFEKHEKPEHISFDDRANFRRTLPWIQFTEARWDYDDPSQIFILIGDWTILLQGHNLGPLFEAIELRQVLRVKTMQPDQCDSERDSFVTEIVLTKVPSGDLSKNKIGTGQLSLL